MQREERKKTQRYKEKDYAIGVGEMSVSAGKVKPNPAKGELRFYNDKTTGYLSFAWTNRETSSSTEPLIITPGDWEWKRVPTKKGRVYSLKSKSYPDLQFYYWMQYPNDGEDNMNEAIINNILETGQLIIDENVIREEEFEGMDQEIKKEESKGQVTEEVAGKKQSQEFQNPDIIKNFNDALNSLDRNKMPSLGKVLNSQILKGFDAKDMNNLLSDLPANQQTKEDLLETVSSPQFQQTVQSFSEALNSENLQMIIQSFGLDTQTSMKYRNGVEAFIKCIVEKYKKQN